MALEARPRAAPIARRRLGVKSAALGDPYLGGDRPGVADVLDVTHFIAAVQMIELAAQQAVAVEVQQAAFLGHQEAEVLLRRQFGDLAAKFMRGLVPEL